MAKPLSKRQLLLEIKYSLQRLQEATKGSDNFLENIEDSFQKDVLFIAHLKLTEVETYLIKKKK
jgi:hypothetical protein